MNCDLIEPCISGCYFTKCNSTNFSGGGIYILSPPTEFKMQNTIFISCNAKSCGGGFVYHMNGGTIINPKLYYFVYFADNSSPRGNDVHIWDVQNPQRCTETPFVCCYSQSDNTIKKRVCRNKGTDENPDWLPTGTLNRFVKSESEKTTQCGETEENPCKNVNVCISMIKDFGGWHINVLDNIIEDKSISIEKELFVKLIGKSKDVFLSNSDSSSHFSVSGNLEICLFTLKAKDPSLFSVSSTGNVEVTNLFVKCLFLYTYQI